MHRALIFAHYDKDGAVRDHVLHLFRSLRNFCAEAVFVSAASLSPAAREQLETIEAPVIVRDNVGYDFGSYKAGLDRIDRRGGISAFDEIVFCNDSIAGPVNALAPWFATSERFDAAAWGASLSHEYGAHLQSYFFGARRGLLRHAVFGQFWRDLPAARSRDEAIADYELRFSRLLRENGLPIRGAFDPAREFYPGLLLDLARVRTARSVPSRFSALRRRARSLNPTHYYAHRMLRAGHPFVKWELLCRNPNRLNLAPALRQIARNPPLAEAIRAECQRAQNARSIA